MTMTVKMKPIIFSTPMVRAILENRKRQTRRVIKPQPEKGFYPGLCPYSDTGWALWHDKGVCTCTPIPCKHNTGDILYVRETWLENAPGGVSKYFYKADAPEEVILQAKAFGYKWRPSIFMPKDAARLFLKVEGVRVEQLQEIKYSDCIAEGIPYEQYEKVIREKFKELWDRINGKKYPWKSNPYVWVYEFERVDKP